MDGVIGIPPDRRAATVYGFEVTLEGVGAGAGIEQIDIALQPLPYRTFALSDGSIKTVIANVPADFKQIKLDPRTGKFSSGEILHVSDDLNNWLKCYRQGVGGAWQLTFPFVEMQQLNLSALSAIKISIHYFWKPALVPSTSIPDKSVLGEKNFSKKVYYIYGGAKFWIKSPDILFAHYGGWDAVQWRDNSELDTLPLLPQEGTLLIQYGSDPKVYRIEGGTKRWVTTPAVLERYGGWAKVGNVPEGSLRDILDGPPIT
jgi:hypothetical protein